MYQILMLLVGMAMLISALTKRGWLYKLLKARTELLWRDKADNVLLFGSLLIVGLAALWIAGIFWE